MQLIHDDQRAAMKAAVAMDHQVMMRPHVTKNATQLHGSLTGARSSRSPRAQSQVKQSKTIATTLLATAAACIQTTAAMSAQQTADGQQGEDVRAADAMDGPVAIVPM